MSSPKLMCPLNYISSSQLKKYSFFIGFTLFSIVALLGQNLQHTDSLKLKINLGMVQEKDQLKTLKLLIETYHDPDFKIKYSDKLIETATRMDSADYLFRGYIFKGQALSSKGDYKMALENYNMAVQIASNGNNVNHLAMTYSAIGTAYASLAENKNTLDYYTKSLNLFKSIPDSLNSAFTLQKIGDYYLKNKKPDSALVFLKESGEIFQNIGNDKGIGNNLGLTGMVYAQKGIPEFAERYIHEATLILTQKNEYQGLTVYLLCMSDIYFEKGEFQMAHTFAKRGLDLAIKYGLKEQISDAYHKLSDIEVAKGNSDDALLFYKNYVSYKDSLHNHETIHEIAETRSEFEIAMKQREIDSLHNQKENQKIMVIAIVIALFLTSLLAIGLFHRFKFIQKTNLIIEKEMSRSDHLLNNILPLETAQELKERGSVKAKKFESVTVLFTDFKEFTIHSEHLSPEQLVASVNFYFSKFDEIIGKYGLEKIKTIGDSYMCAGGLPFPCRNHPVKVILAAIEIVEFMEESKHSSKKDLAHFEVRIGVNTGPVVAGVVGSKKFAYDIWGDTVNVASRMESNCESGKINVSENTYNRIKENFDCQYRGEIAAKNKGMLKMYYAGEIKNKNTITNKFSAQENEENSLIF